MKDCTKPYRPDRVMQLMRGIKSELEKVQGGPLPFKTLGCYSGESGSTAFDRLHRKHQPQVEALLSLLERVQEPARNRLLTEAFRFLPSLSDPRLAHDQVQISQLRGIIRQDTGFTIIQGANPGIRTFLITALGLEARCGIRGLDIHRPDWFVPAEGVLYLNEGKADTLRSLCSEVWPQVIKSPRDPKRNVRLFLFNGVWLACCSLQARIIEQAARAHCIIADELQFRAETLPKRLPPPVHILTVHQERHDRLRVQIQSI